MITKKETIAVLFGGRSSEHEISIITALQAIQAIDPVLYTILPVYIAMSGKWYTGDSLLDKKFYQNLSKTLPLLQQVSLLPDPTIGGLVLSNEEIIDRNRKIAVDLCFLAFHGQNGEDGCIQGLLELANLPYTGCGVGSAALTMNKYACKMFLRAHGIPVLPSITVHREEIKLHLETIGEKILSKLQCFPLFIKPCHLGSSIGISRATNLPELYAGLAKVFLYDERAIIEPCVEDLLEINVAVLGGSPPIASVVEIPLSQSGNILTYEDKYLTGGNKNSSSGGMADLSRVIDPATLDSSIKKQVIDTALLAFSLLNCSGVSRFDYLYDKKSGKLYFNEVNTIPGSLAYYLWEKCNPPILYTEVINRMLQEAREKRAVKLSVNEEIGFKALRGDI